MKITCNTANMSKNLKKTATTTTIFDLSQAKIWRCSESSCAIILCFSEALWYKYASFPYRTRHVGAKLSMGMMSTVSTNSYVLPVEKKSKKFKIQQNFVVS